MVTPFLYFEPSNNVENCHVILKVGKGCANKGIKPLLFFDNIL